MFPSVRYRADGATTIVNSYAEMDALGREWAATPAAFGIETCPGVEFDPAIAANAQPVPEPKKRRK